MKELVKIPRRTLTKKRSEINTVTMKTRWMDKKKCKERKTQRKSQRKAAKWILWQWKWSELIENVKREKRRGNVKHREDVKNKCQAEEQKTGGRESGRGGDWGEGKELGLAGGKDLSARDQTLPQGLHQSLITRSKRWELAAISRRCFRRSCHTRSKPA